MNRQIIFWDIGNVLFKIRIADFLRAVINAGHQEKVCQCDLDNIITRSFHGTLSFGETIDGLVDITKCRKSTVMEIMSQSWVIPNCELIKCMRHFSLNFHQGIISDMWHIPFFWIRRDYQEFLSIFNDDKIFFSHLVGMTKKEDGERNLIRRAACACGPSSTGMCIIDDDPHVIQIASHFGMHAIHFPYRGFTEGCVNWENSNEVVVKKLQEEFLTIQL